MAVLANLRNDNVLYKYKERIAYDANGNILKYLRNGDNSSKILMDSFNYKYYTGTNRLNHVSDNVPDGDYASPGYEDTDGQDLNNYTYDAIGNLIADNAEHITNISWNVYGKITLVNYSNTATGTIKNVYYYYNAAGNRMGKRAEKNTSTGTSNIFTWYVRDASGNVMAVYSATTNNSSNPGNLSVKERHMYGSSRLGILTLNKDVKAAIPSYTQTTYKSSFIRGYKYYELSNHLGNVLATVSDKKFGHTSNSTTIDYYNADMVSATDYMPFGSSLPNRSFGSSTYRYAFNGKEKDKDGTGTSVQYDYGFRIYDPHLGRFKSVDPITEKYPELTSYQFASNSPIANVDLDGLEKLIYIFNFSVDKITKTKIELSKAGPLGDGILVKSNYKGKVKFYYGKTISDGNITSFKKSYEGVKLDKEGNHVGYKDSKGNPTIGYGHLIKKGESYKVGDKMIDADAQTLFNVDVKIITTAVDKKLSTFTLTANQTNALYDASFNLGPGKLSQYKEDDTKYSGENFFLKFMGDGEGIRKRRFAENLLYSEGTYNALDVLKGKKNTAAATKVISDNEPKPEPKPEEKKEDPK